MADLFLVLMYGLLLILRIDIAASNDNSSSVLIPITDSRLYAAENDVWQRYVNESRVVRMEPGCGRMQNRLVTFEDGTKACARYRLNTSLMQGEIYSWIIAQLLGITNLPLLALTLPDIKTEQWSRVSAAVLEANWQSNKLLVLTKYIDDIEEVHLPEELKTKRHEAITPHVITPDNKDMIAQWSDMIVFDYIIANMDRLVNSLHNKQWNSNIMSMPVHNLARKDNSLIFLDNEDGLFHGYKILDRYKQYHEQSLKTLCVFSKTTADSIHQLITSDNLLERLSETILNTEPNILKYLPKLSQKTCDMLSKRLSLVDEHITQCQRQYS